MAGISGDFTGFTFNGIHSSTLGITRISDNGRYNDELIPTSKDTTAEAVGRDETYYWESFYTKKTIGLNFAFDSLSESDIRRLRQVFGIKQQATLWFDERPYKQYLVKVTGVTFKNLCFDENNQRVYKGEGTLQFSAFYPFAVSRYKWLNQYSDTNKDEWKDSSGMAATQGSYDVVGSNTRLYNPGDLESDCYIYYDCTASNSQYKNTLEMVYVCDSNDSNHISQMVFDSSYLLSGSDNSFRINSRANVIEGTVKSTLGEYTLSGNIYNDMITSGDFFKIPLCDVSNPHYLKSTGANSTKLDYSYIYY